MSCDVCGESRYWSAKDGCMTCSVGKKRQRLEAIVDRLPKTADGVPFFIGDKVFSPNPDREYFGSDAILEVTIESIFKGASFVEYRGEFTVSGTGSDIEGGNLDFYSTREACPNYGE
jgi:hypothetical protein